MTVPGHVKADIAAAIEAANASGHSQYIHTGGIALSVRPRLSRQDSLESTWAYLHSRQTPVEHAMEVVKRGIKVSRDEWTIVRVLS